MTGKMGSMVSIWFMVGVVLIVYGFIVTGCGVYYVFVPETATALHSLNPSLWWGIIMVLAGAALTALGKFGRTSA